MTSSRNEHPETGSDLQAQELVFASWEENLDKVKSLVSDGVDVNAQTGPGLTAYHCARLRGSADLLEWLLENGADPDVRMPDKDQIVDLLFRRNADANAPGGALAVVHRGLVVATSCYGLANLEHKAPIAPTTVFHVGSVAKQFVGFAVATLVQQGKISLEDDIGKYIPELNGMGHVLRIEHLLHHTSGLRDWPGTLCLSGWSLDDVISFDHVLTMAFNQKGINFEPGSEHFYSNTGYNLLAELVQRVTGKSFREWTEAHIFRPLGMTCSHFHDDHTELVPGKAYGYAVEKDGFHALPDNLSAVGSGALYSTIEDLSRWAINLDTHQVGGDSVFDLMYRPGTLNNGERISYAGGIDTGEHRGAKTIGHGGGWAGLTSFVQYFTEHRLVAVVLYNVNSDVYGAIKDVADVYLGEELARKVKSERGKKQSTQVPVALLERYVGTYKVFPAWYITISREGSQLMALETNKEIYALDPISETEFLLKTRNAPIEFNVDDSDQVSSLNLMGMVCPKVQAGPTPTLSPLTEDLAGDYYSDELDVRYTISIQDGELVARHRRHGTCKLVPAWKDDFRGELWFMRSVEFNRDKGGMVRGFTVTQWQSRYHRFVKLGDRF